jgi:hypothetical protein
MPFVPQYPRRTTREAYWYCRLEDKNNKMWFDIYTLQNRHDYPFEECKMSLDDHDFCKIQTYLSTSNASRGRRVAFVALAGVFPVSFHFQRFGGVVADLLWQTRCSWYLFSA